MDNARVWILDYMEQDFVRLIGICASAAAAKNYLINYFNYRIEENNEWLNEKEAKKENEIIRNAQRYFEHYDFESMNIGQGTFFNGFGVSCEKLIT